MHDETSTMPLSSHPPLYELIKLLKATLSNVETVLEEEKVIAKKHSVLKELNVSHLKEVGEEVAMRDTMD
jgi:hypothetical protein